MQERINIFDEILSNDPASIELQGALDKITSPSENIDELEYKIKLNKFYEIISQIPGMEASLEETPELVLNSYVLTVVPIGNITKDSLELIVASYEEILKILNNDTRINSHIHSIIDITEMTLSPVLTPQLINVLVEHKDIQKLVGSQWLIGKGRAFSTLAIIPKMINNKTVTTAVHGNTKEEAIHDLEKGLGQFAKSIHDRESQ